MPLIEDLFSARARGVLKQTFTVRQSTKRVVERAVITNGFQRWVRTPGRQVPRTGTKLPSYFETLK